MATPPSLATSSFLSPRRYAVTPDARRFHTPFPRQRTRILCNSEVNKLLRRKCSPYLGSVYLEEEVHEWKAVPDVWKSLAKNYGDRVALVDPYHKPSSKLTYKQLEQEILRFSEGLRVIGVEPEEKLAIFADNSCRWLIADQGSMASGAINVVRGSRSSDEELLQIYRHSESCALVVDNPQFFNRLPESFWNAKVRFVVLLWGEKSCLNYKTSYTMPVYEYNEIIQLGQESRDNLLQNSKQGQKYLFDAIKPADVAALMYTSGTSGVPKGVMLTHQNFLHQINNYGEIVPAEAGDRFLSMLPPWHAYERTCEYFIFTRGIEQVYSNVKTLKVDLERYQPHYLISVPLVYETLYSSIQKQISSSSAARKFVARNLIKISLLYMEAKRIYEGKVLTNMHVQQSFTLVLVDWLWARIIAAFLWPLHYLGIRLVYRKIQSAIGISKAGISGGGTLPIYVDKFFEAIGIKLQNGYGLTETSPVLAARHPDCNVLGTVGHPLNHTKIKVVDLETGQVLPDGSKGVIKVKGPQLMKGYYKNPSATNEAIDEDGWFNTGDIGWIAPKHPMGRSRKCGGMLVLEGRAKDTIVLTTGENVEPGELEEAALQSNLIQQILVIGQDQRRLGALIVPNKEELLTLAKSQSLITDNSELSNDIITSLLHEELRNWTAGFPFQIGPILVMDEPFTIDNGLMTPTMKVRRNKVVEKYSEKIKNLYK